MCGEQTEAGAAGLMGNGSPPRVRGTARRVCTGGFCCRITPACAGNSLQPIIRHRLPWDHPRVCGEQHFAIGFFISDKGSPPRVRGTAARPLRSAFAGRITPACAGNRSTGTRL